MNASLESEVAVWLDNEMPLLLVHEQRTGQNAVPFGSIIEITPRALLEDGVYRMLAVPLYDGDNMGDEHHRVCLRMMINQLSPEDVPAQGRWPWRWLFASRLTAFDNREDTPALLEMASVVQSGKV